MGRFVGAVVTGVNVGVFVGDSVTGTNVGVFVGDFVGATDGILVGATVGGWLIMRNDTVLVNPLVPLAVLPEYGVAETTCGNALVTRFVQVW